MFLHEHSDFIEICAAARDQTKASIQIVEKDYWVMHSLWCLTQSNLNFELKGGTSLSKAWNIVDRFSEDIDIHIHPPEGMKVYSGKNHDKPKHIKSRNQFYDWLPNNIQSLGVHSVIRDPEWDDSKFRNCGIKIFYDSKFESEAAIKPHGWLGWDWLQWNLIKVLQFLLGLWILLKLRI